MWKPAIQKPKGTSYSGTERKLTRVPVLQYQRLYIPALSQLSTGKLEFSSSLVVLSYSTRNRTSTLLLHLTYYNSSSYPLAMPSDYTSQLVLQKNRITGLRVFFTNQIKRFFTPFLYFSFFIISSNSLQMCILTSCCAASRCGRRMTLFTLVRFSRQALRAPRIDFEVIRLREDFIGEV